MTRIAVVILNWNGEKFLRKFFPEVLLKKVIDGPEKCCHRFAGAGRGKNQGVLSFGDAGPSENLRRRWSAIGPQKPLPDDRVEVLKGMGLKRDRHEVIIG